MKKNKSITSDGSSPGWDAGADLGDYSMSGISYDRNGNLRTLRRMGDKF